MPYKDPEKRRQANLEANRRYRARHPERWREITLRSQVKRWQEEGCDPYLGTRQRWKERNWGKVLNYCRKSNAKRKAAQMDRTIGEIDYRVIQYRTCGCCGICGLQVDQNFHYDHIIPLARGGAHVTGNLQLAHPLCNSRKRATLPSHLEAA